MKEDALVACIGNAMAADDAAGCAVYDRLQAEPLPGFVRTEMLGCSELSLLDTLSGGRLLVLVDAVQFGAAPGTVHVLPWDRIPPACRPAVSIHGIGIREAIDIARSLRPDTIPQRIVLVGIEGENFDELGEKLTPGVKAGVDEAVNVILRLVSGP